MMRANLFKARPPPEIPDQRSQTPETEAGFLGHLVFSWLSPLLAVGFRRALEHDDIWLLSDTRSASRLEQKLTRSFENRAIKRQSLDSRLHWNMHPLAGALYDSFTFDVWLGGVCQLVESILQALAPFTLRFLIIYAREAYSYMNGDQELGPPISRGMGIVLAITAMQVTQSFASCHFHYRGALLGGQSRSALIAMIFSKSLRLSRRAKAGCVTDTETSMLLQVHAGNAKSGSLDWRLSPEGWSNGRVMSLISTDISRIEQSCTTFHLIWTSPVAILLTVALLVVNLGYSALAGVAVLTVGLAALTKVVKVLTTLRSAINVLTDERAGLTQEILHGIRFVKYFGWEFAFLHRLQAIRASETRSLQILHITKSAIGAVSMALPIFSSMAAFFVYSTTNPGPLNPALVFSSLALFNSLRTPMNWLPTAIGHLVDAISALRRTETFLLAEEADPPPDPNPALKHAIEIRDATFTWESSPAAHMEKNEIKPSKTTRASRLKRTRRRDNEEKTTTNPGKEIKVSILNNEALPFRLENLSATILSGELIAVVGSVGCGKSSLLSALANDMRLVAGNLEFSSKTAYCPQSAWLQNATIRDNILFGKAFNEGFYRRVVQACALEADFDLLPQGDLTEIGEKGITLSGGQKQRINIARAIYSDAGIVLLDDPLSAVDAHVGDQIFSQAICGLLQDKCCVLVTHQLHVLPRCDRIIWMVDGRINANGTYESLIENAPSFVKFVETSGFLGSGSQQVEETAGKVTIGPQDKVARLERDINKTQTKLMQEDVKAVNSVPWSVYHAWIKSSGSLFNGAAILILMSVFRAANLLTSLSLAWWVSDAYGLSRASYIGIYAGLGVAQAVLLFAFSMTTCIVGAKASQTMSNDAMWKILRAPIVFFDTTPLGRIIHRFTKDVDIMDNNLTDSFRQYLIVLSSLLGSFGFIIAYFHYFAIALAIVSIVLVLAVSYYRCSARELKRHHVILDGAVFAKFGEALVGASTIRAYGREQHYMHGLHHAIDEMNGAYFLTFASQRWLSLRLDNLGNILSFTTGVLVVMTTFTVPPSITGLILSYSLSLVGIIQITVRYFADVDNSMSSTERLYQYTSSLALEASLEDGDASPIRPSWPEQGEIWFESVQMRYRPELPLVLDGFSLKINGGERIGIVGRTGAGKSTILSTLFRLTELSGGRILIDGVDISKMGLHSLRSRLAIIPQDPTLFRGTIRSNLDPFGKHGDLEMWNALRHAHLVPDEPDASAINTMAEEVLDAGTNAVSREGVLQQRNKPQEPRITLDSVVEEEGLNYSLGQRQLLALARAHLRNARITLIDEGTSSVDSATDVLVQQTIARELGNGKTLIAIAHRLRTVLLYDRVCVMDQGRIVELGPPRELWEKESIFRGMCERSGITREDFLSH